MGPVLAHHARLLRARHGARRRAASTIAAIGLWASTTTAVESDEAPSTDDEESEPEWLKEADDLLRRRRLARMSNKAGAMRPTIAPRGGADNEGIACGAAERSHPPSLALALGTSTAGPRTVGINPYLSQHRWIADAIAREVAADDDVRIAARIALPAVSPTIGFLDITAESSPSTADSASPLNPSPAFSTSPVPSVDGDEAAAAPGEVVARPRARTRHPTRAGG